MYGILLQINARRIHARTTLVIFRIQPEYATLSAKLNIAANVQKIITGGE